MTFIDSLISFVIVAGFLFFIGSKVYDHEKEHLDPIIKKVKGWFAPKDNEDEYMGPEDDYELAFRGQMR